MSRALVLVPIVAKKLRAGDVVEDGTGRPSVVQEVRLAWLGWLGMSPRVLIRGVWTTVTVSGWPARVAIGR
ncbi:MAG: hypothetical protein JWM31_1095 [Solirubrobacterales bacterium]|nr:hypothetical protein [Solirubrobacterales bacterium]